MTSKLIQISPYGVFEKIEADGKRKVQLCDAVAFDAVLADWIKRGRPKILLDYLHKRGEAAGWIGNLRVDPLEGLMGECDYTPPGEKAVLDKLWRFPSVDWWCGSDNRPFAINTVALTNTPNIPVKPIVNSAGGPAAGGSVNNNPKGNNSMEAIKKLLGLPPEADEAAVVAAIQALLDANVKTKGEAVAAANADRIQNSAEFVAAYCQAPGAVEAAIKALKATPAPAAAATRVTNSAEARTPSQAFAGARKFGSKKEASAALAAQPVGQRKKFYDENKASFEED